MKLCKTCGNNIITLEKPFCSNCGAIIEPEATEINMSKQIAHDESVAPGRIVLHVASILYIIFGSLGVIWALLGVHLSDYVDLYAPHPSGMPWRVYYIIILLRACFHLAVGILGIINRKQLKNASMLRILGCIDIGFVILRIAYDTVFLLSGISVILLNIIIRLMFPILYIIGASRNLRAYRNNQNCQYYESAIKKLEHRVFKCMGFLVGIIILTLTLSITLNVSTGNTWLGIVYINAIGLVIVKMLWDATKFFKEKHCYINRLCIFFSAMVVIGLIVHNIYFFT